MPTIRLALSAAVGRVEGLAHGRALSEPQIRGESKGFTAGSSWADIL
ncbi:MAG TPA: hypothetical protein VFT47_09615 [Vicinamibacterales bacterium]|nr:hypothetical protein [Vicinamibacterales bacterium]